MKSVGRFDVRLSLPIIRWRFFNWRDHWAASASEGGRDGDGGGDDVDDAAAAVDSIRVPCAAESTAFCIFIFVSSAQYRTSFLECFSHNSKIFQPFESIYITFLYIYMLMSSRCYPMRVQSTSIVVRWCTQRHIEFCYKSKIPSYKIERDRAIYFATTIKWIERTVL